MAPIGDVDELGRDAEAGARFPHASLQDRFDAEIVPDLADVVTRSLEPKGRGPRTHLEPTEMRERIDELLGHPLAEVLLVSFGAHVQEREHGD